MSRSLPNALHLLFNRLAAIPLQLKREAMPPRKRRRSYGKKRRKKT